MDTRINGYVLCEVIDETISEPAFAVTLDEIYKTMQERYNKAKVDRNGEGSIQQFEAFCINQKRQSCRWKIFPIYANLNIHARRNFPYGY